MDHLIKFRAQRYNGDWEYFGIEGHQFNICEDTLGMYVGHNDKNEIEIYDGDIFTVNEHYPRLVKWDKNMESFAFAFLEDIHNNGMDKVVWHSVDKYWWNGYKEQIEVIGNIYELEILKEKYGYEI